MGPLLLLGVPVGPFPVLDLFGMIVRETVAMEDGASQEDAAERFMWHRKRRQFPLWKQTMGIEVASDTESDRTRYYQSQPELFAAAVPQ